MINFLDDETWGYLVFDPAGIVEFANREAASLLGEDAHDLIGLTVKTFQLRLAWAHLILPIQAAIAGRIYESDVMRPKDRRRWRVRTWPLKHGGACCRFERIRDQPRAALVGHDPLTALPNRQLFTQNLFHRLEEARQLNKTFCVACLDLDFFKWVNSTLGQRAGDALLVAVSLRLNNILPRGSFSARFGGDEFAAALPLVESAEHGNRIWATVLECLSELYTINGHRTSVRASIGAVSFPEGSGRAATSDDLLDRADFSLRQAKGNGRGRIVLMDAAAANDFEHQKNRVIWIHKAVANQTFELYYQPLIEATSGRILGFEALLRSYDQTPGISIAQVIDLAETEGLMPDLGRWVFETACAQLADWRRQGHDVSVSINLAPAQLLTTNFADEARRILENYHLTPEQIILEITENLAMSQEATITQTTDRMLRDGFLFALDDFGSQYASIGRLARLPFHQIKFDKALTAQLEFSSRESRLVSMMMGMLNSDEIGFHVVAEGIENETLREQATLAGAEILQGFGLFRPMTAKAAGDMLTKAASLPAV